MNRRQFVQATVSSLLMPGVVIAASAGTLNQDSLASDYFFFDERFAQARRLAGELSGSTAPTAVQGDITDIWTGHLGQASLEAPLTMQGVTTESFHFCLKTLLRDHARVDTQVSRIGPDLYLWTIRTHNFLKSGIPS